MIDDYKAPQKQQSAPTGGSPLFLPQHENKPYGNDILLPDETKTPDITKLKKPVTINVFGRWPVSRKKFVIVLIILILAFVGGGVYAVVNYKPRPVTPAVTKPSNKVASPVAPAPIVSPLTGLVVPAEKQKYPVIGVMIENSGDARPQSGLKDAGVVYEAIAEAGITRFLALYQENRPGNVGPIRSSRPYYLDWAMAFDASYAHVGGSPDALQRIKDIGVKDLDQFYNADAYHRISTRYAPHNVYTGVQNLVDVSAAKGWTSSSFTSFDRKAEQPYTAASGTPQPVATTNGSTPSTVKTAPADGRTPAKSIDFGISSAFFNAHYDYDAASNSYKRSEGGEAHMDLDSNSQLSPKVVVALVMPYSLMADGYHSQYNTQGSGQMFVFQDGTVVGGTWAKGDPKSQFVFKDDAGKALALNPGQAWISVVADAGKVSYQ